jgi:hypothetical protein
MYTAYPGGYEAPYIDAAGGTTREPAGLGDEDGTNVPNYVGFCTTCHNAIQTLTSTTLSRELKKINWTNSGLLQNKHGELTRDGTDLFREPYATAASTKGNFVLSCLDCHESHGSENIMLLRGRINGENLEGTVDTTDAMSYFCKRCHTDDLAAGAGTGEPDKWEYVHHLAAGAPYAQQMCGTCHGGGGMGGEPIPCGNCHGHGMTDSWAPAGSRTGRITF